MSHISLMLAQSSSSSNAAAGAAAGAAVLMFVLFILIVALVVYLIMAISCVKILTKAGQVSWPGWVPIYNFWRLFEISGKHGAFSLLFLGGIIPIVGGFIVLAGWIFLGISVGKAFNKSTGFIVGLAIPLVNLVFYPLLAFGDSTYQPQAAAQGFPVGPPQ